MPEHHQDESPLVKMVFTLLSESPLTVDFSPLIWPRSLDLLDFVENRNCSVY